MRNPVHYGFCAALYCSSHTINILKLDQEIILSLLRPPGSKLQHIKLENKVYKRSNQSCGGDRFYNLVNYRNLHHKVLYNLQKP